MQQTVNLSNGKSILMRDASIQLARVKTCFEITGWSKISLKESEEHISYKPGERAGLPDTCQYEGLNNEQNASIKLTEHIQTVWYNELIKLVPGMTKAYYDAQANGLWAGDRWVTNAAGSKDHRVYPTGKNEDKDPMRYETVLTAGAILEIVGVEKYWPAQNGRFHAPFRCINASLPMTDFTPDKVPYCWYQPRNSVRDPLLEWNNNHTQQIFKGNYNENISEVFHWFDNKAIAPILMPNTNVGWIPSEILEFL